MTPQEKAKELITKFHQSGYETGYNDVRDVHAAIRCSLIAVDEIIENEKIDEKHAKMILRQVV
jgi:hypothetical protein